MLACAACNLGNHPRAHWPLIVRVGPEIEKIATPSGLWAGDSFTFSAEINGSPVVSWDWDFGGGAHPNTSTKEKPTVILVNPSPVKDAEYTCALTVTDAQGNSDTTSTTYWVGYGCEPPPVFVGLPASITGNFSFSIHDVDGDDVLITIEVVQGDVTVEPTVIYATSANYGPFYITVTNNGVDEQSVELEITLDNGWSTVVDSVSGTVSGRYLDPDTIYLIPDSGKLSCGEAVRVVVYTGGLPDPVGQFDSIRLVAGEGLEPVSYSFNLGVPGGLPYEKDGLFNQTPDNVTALDLTPEQPYSGFVEWAIVMTSPGIPAGTAGPIFNLEYRAVEPGTWSITFDPEYTAYIEPDGMTRHSFTAYEGCEVVVTPAEE